jgi:ferrochelatase
MNQSYDALIIISFGGPEGMADVMPFLDNVLRGKNVPEERKREVAHHYEMFDGVSPINAHNRELKILLEKKIKEEGIHLPVFWGNRNWNPYFKDALLEMKATGVKNALGYFTSAYGSYSGCRQYRENIEQARAEVGEGAPQVQRLPNFYNHPKFIQANVNNILVQLRNVPETEHSNVHLAFTAHSIPMSMAQTSPYLDQLNEACERVAGKVGAQNWKLVFQSRSGPPHMPWLEPDICDHLENLSKSGVEQVIVSPIGFVSDHMEVMYDLDVEAKQKAQELGLNMYRAASAGNDPLMIDMIVDMVKDALKSDVVLKCAPNCCPSPRRP